MPPIYRKLLTEYDDITLSELTVGEVRYPSVRGAIGQVLTQGPDGVIVFSGNSTGVTGTGRTNYLAKFLTPKVVTTSLLYESGSKIGVGTELPTETFDISGSLRIRTVNNATGSFSTVSDTGVVSKRTPLETLLDIDAVPYTGAIKNVNLGEYGITAGYYQFDTTPTNTPTTQGTMFWDVDDLTVDIILNGYRMKIGEDIFYPVKNQTASLIPKGTNVRFAGTVGSSSRLLIAPFLANGTFPSSYYMGVTAEDIPSGEDGKVLWFGRIRGINTNSYLADTILYASTTVAGGFQTTIPQAPNNIIEVAAVVNKSINQGTIFVRPQLGSNINKDEGVKIVNPQAGDILVMNSSGLFENQSLDSATSEKVSYDKADNKDETKKLQARTNIDVYSKLQIDTVTGDLNNLNTVDKSNLVIGINQANAWKVIEW
jgi:hypothetical protein